MSSSRSSIASRCASEGEICELIFKLQALLPERSLRNLRTVPASEVLKEVCSYIRKLQNEVDGLSERLSELLASVGHHNTVDADIIRSLLQH